MKVLVTGGSGWIGKATCGVLEKRGHTAIAYDRTEGRDIRDQLDVDDAVKEVDHCVHLAGLLGTHELFAQPHEAVAVNVLGSLNITKSCTEHEVGLTEITMPRVNPSLYAATKACAMDIANAYRISEGLRVSFVRAYNAYGPAQAYGDSHPQKIVPTFATKAWSGEPLPVWGDGHLLTDLVHVDDVARMLVEAMAFGDGQVFDAGSGYAQTVMTVAEKVISIVQDKSGMPGSIEHLEPRKGERTQSTSADFASGEGWELLSGWRPVFDSERFVEAVMSYRP